jgi:hypothetical protein
MTKLLALTLWLLAFTAALFVLAINIWQGAPVLHFVGAVALGMIGPLATWAISKRYPETDRAAWVCLGITGGIIAARTLLRLV